MKELAAALIVSLGVLGGPAFAAENASRSNVLFIVADDLRPDLGCYGRAEIYSPNLDRLAERGLVFERAYCQVALCNPSRASVLTGRRPQTTRVLDNGAHVRAAMPEVVTLPQFFRVHGWHAQGVGKIFHPGCDDAPSWSEPHWHPQQQFEVAGTEALIAKHAAYYGEEGGALVRQRAAAAMLAGKTLKPRDLLGPAWEAPEVADEELLDGQTATRAMEVLREVKDRPFFLAVGFLKPHLPFVAPKKYWDLYPPEKISPASPLPPKDAPPWALHEWSELRAFTGIPKTGPLSEEQARQMIRGYRAATSYLDAQVGRVLGELDRLGLREKTVVVFWGDHGWQLGEHGLWCKHTNFELATRAPLILSAPGMNSAGRRTAALVEFVDIYPTLAALCGLPLSPQLEGTSLAPLLANPEQPWKRAAFSEYLRPGKDSRLGYSMRTERYRFTRWVRPEDHTQVDALELYDHANDPQENVNLAGDPRQAELIAKLTAQALAGWRAAVPK